MPTRRERQRAETLAEIRARALDQVDAGGAEAVSLNAIAKAMGLSGPALYRYFASRDALLADLVTNGYADLAAALRAANGPDAEARLRAVVAAYRAWAVAHPRRFALLFGHRPDGVRDPEAAILAISDAMDLLLELLGELVPAGEGEPPPDVAGWAARRVDLDPAPGPAVLEAALRLWTRLHGVVALEQAGALGDMGLDVDRLLQEEVNALVS